MPPSTFISFSSTDLAAAVRICHDLERAGIACWMSKRDIGPGEDFQEAIIDALESCCAMVLVFSANSNNSEEVKKELVLAAELKLPVLPVRIENVMPSRALRYQLATRQFLDLFDDWDANIARLSEQIRRILAVPAGARDDIGSAASAGNKDAVPKPSGLRAIVFGSALLVSAVATFAVVALRDQRSPPAAIEPAMPAQAAGGASAPTARQATVAAADSRPSTNPSPKKIEQTVAALAPAPRKEAEPAPEQEAPAPAPSPMVRRSVAETKKISVSLNVYFDYDRTALNPQAKMALDELAAQMQTIAYEAIIVEGHTAAPGSDAANQKTSGNMAEAVKSYLVSKGIEANRIYTVGRGEKAPAASNSTAAGRAENRRAWIEAVGSLRTPDAQ